MGGEEALAGVLRTKLYAPRLPEIIPREKLLQELAAARKAKLTTIVAGAGYGKSTLASAFLASGKAPFVWYQLEETDRDLSEFITYLVAGIRLQVSGFGEEALARLRSADEVTAMSRVILSSLVSEMDASIKDDFFVVLDDFQQVNGSAQISEALSYILDHLPPSLHLIILSREKPDLDLSPLAARRELIEIGESDLGLSTSETSQLFSEVFGMPLQDRDARTLCEHTEGWITGLVLFWLAARDRGREQVSDDIKDLKVPPARIAEYLSGVVFESQSERVREFTTRTSILSRLNPAFCDRLLETGESDIVLDHLANSRMFTIPLDDRGDWYRYHHLLQAFLRERLSESCSTQEIRELNLKAAALWEEYGEPEQSLHHYMEAEDFQGAAGVLNGMAPALMEASRISFLLDVLNRIPLEILEKHPRLLFYLADTSYLHGDYGRSLRASDAAASLFEQSGDTGALLSSLMRAGLAAYQMGRLDEYEAAFARLLEHAPVGSPLWYSLSVFESSTSLFTGEQDMAGRFLAQALEHAYELEDESSRSILLFYIGYVMLYRGDYRRACGIIREAGELAERLNLTPLLMNTYCVLSPAAYMLGRFEESLRCAEQGLALSERMGRDTPYTYLYRVSKAIALEALGDIDAARREMEEALAISGKHGASAEAMYAELFMGNLYMYEGERGQALCHYGRAKRMARDLPFLIVEHMARLGEIRASYERMGLETAIEEVKAIAGYTREGYNDTLATYPFLVLALLERAAGRDEKAEQALQAALEMAESGGGTGSWWSVLQGEEAEMLFPSMAGIFSRGEHLDVLGQGFAYAGPASIPTLGKLAGSRDARVKDKAGEVLERITRQAAEPLEIRMLGAFEVARGGKTITSGDWRSRKALTAMKYLAAQEEKRLVPKDVLMELLWPEATPEAASKNLGVALSSLRKTLEPGSARGKSSYLAAEGDSLRLELGRGGWIDYRLFRERITEAEKARSSGESDLYLERLQEAEELYRGDFLAEDLYEDWCRPERERLHGEYIDLMLNISSEYRRRGILGKALRCMEKAVEADPGREDLCRGQMEICADMGNRTGLERAFQRLSTYLGDEFEVEPSPETVDLYRRLRGD